MTRAAVRFCSKLRCGTRAIRDCGKIDVDADDDDHDESREGTFPTLSGVMSQNDDTTGRMRTPIHTPLLRCLHRLYSTAGEHLRRTSDGNVYKTISESKRVVDAAPFSGGRGERARRRTLAADRGGQDLISFPPARVAQLSDDAQSRHF